MWKDQSKMELLVIFLLCISLSWRSVAAMSSCNTQNAVCSMRGRVRGTITFKEQQGTGCFNSGNIQVVTDLIGFPANNNNKEKTNNVYSLRLKSYGETMPACSGVGPDFGSGITGGEIGAFTPDQDGHVYNDTSYLPRSSTIKGRSSIVGRSVAIYSGPYSIYGNNPVLDCCVIGYGLPTVNAPINSAAPGIFGGNSGTFGRGSKIGDDKFTLIGGYGNVNNNNNNQNNNNNPAFGFQSSSSPFGNTNVQSLYGGNSFFGNGNPNNNNNNFGGAGNYDSVYNRGNANYNNNNRAPIFGSAVPANGGNFNGQQGQVTNNRNFNGNPSGAGDSRVTSGNNYNGNYNRGNNGFYNDNNNNNNKNSYTNSQFPSVFQNMGSPDFFNLDVSPNNGGDSRGYQQGLFSSGGSLFNFPSPPGTLGASVNFKGTGIASDRAQADLLTPNDGVNTLPGPTAVNSNGQSPTVAGSEPASLTSNRGSANSKSTSTPYLSGASFIGGASGSSIGARRNTSPTRPRGNNARDDQSLSEVFFATEKGNPAAALLPSGGFKREFDASLPGQSTGSYANTIMGGSDYGDTFDSSNLNNFYNSDYLSSDTSKTQGNRYSNTNSDYQDSNYDYSETDPDSYSTKTQGNRYSDRESDYPDSSYDYSETNPNSYPTAPKDDKRHRSDDYNYSYDDYPYYNGDYDSNDYRDVGKYDHDTGSYSDGKYTNNDKNKKDNYEYNSYDKETNEGYSITNDDLNNNRDQEYRDRPVSANNYNSKFVPSSDDTYGHPTSQSASNKGQSSLSSPSPSSGYTPYQSRLNSVPRRESINDDYNYSDLDYHKDATDDYNSSDYPDSLRGNTRREPDIPHHLNHQSYHSDNPSLQDDSNIIQDHDNPSGNYPDSALDKDVRGVEPDNRPPPPNGYIANYDNTEGDQYHYNDQTPPSKNSYASPNSHSRGDDSYEPRNKYGRGNSYVGSNDYGEPEIATSFARGEEPDKVYENSNAFDGQLYYEGVGDADTSYAPTDTGDSFKEYGRPSGIVRNEANAPFDDNGSPSYYRDGKSVSRENAPQMSDYGPINQGFEPDSGRQISTSEDSQSGKFDNIYGDIDSDTPSDSYSNDHSTVNYPKGPAGSQNSESPTSDTSDAINLGALDSSEFIGPVVSSSSLTIVPDENQFILLPTSGDGEPKPFISKGPQPFSRSK